MNIFTAAEMRALEQRAHVSGFPFSQMMQNAGSAAAKIIFARIQVASLKRVLLLCGPGNNGGDGLVCAAQLHDMAKAAGHALHTQVYLLRPRDDADPLMHAVRERGLFTAAATQDLRLRVLHQMVAHAGLIVDALLGTGTQRNIDGDLRKILDEVREVREIQTPPAPVLVALDGVTGMNYDTGALDAASIAADLTITFHAPKRGHVCFPAAGATGELMIAPIGIEALPEETATTGVRLLDDANTRAILPKRRADANKGTHGRVLVVGGSDDYVGAPALAATAAYRVGSGLVTLHVPRESKPIVAAVCRECTFTKELEAGLDNVRALLIGPGMGNDASARERLDNVIAWSQARELAGVILDADALNMLSPFERNPFKQPVIVTPHPGEMARLAGTTVETIQADRIGNALKYSAQWGVVVVLKGANTVIASPAGQAHVLASANPAMATAGTGDVLAGCIAGMLAQGLSSLDAACCGACVHARAGENWRAKHGDAGLLASDLLALLPNVIHEMKS